MLINRPLFFTKRVEILFCRVFTWMKASVYGEKKDSPEVNTVCEHSAGRGRRARRKDLESFGWILVCDAFG